MNEVVRYVSVAVNVSKRWALDVAVTINELNLAVKIYLLLVHIFFLALLVVIVKRKTKSRVVTARERTRTVRVADRAVTIESCDWLNSTLQWLFQNSVTGRTPDLIRLWIRALNRQLLRDRKKGLKIVIEDLRSGCLPPKLVNVYCVSVDGSLQCVTFHIEWEEMGFIVNSSHCTSKGQSSSSKLVMNIKLKGEVAFKMNAKPKSLQACVSFIGNPEISLNTTVLQKDGSDPPVVETVEEKVKDVICKTVTNIPLQPDQSVKEKPLSPSAESCVGHAGKLLIKVIKATELQGRIKNSSISPYCVICTDNPAQRKRTSMLRDDKNPFWNEYLAFNVTAKTKEISFDLYDFDKTDSELNCHLDETEPAVEEDDFLGQVVVPLATVNRNQTCRMVLPVLPKSYKSEYAHGQLSLEFTFDKDGKVIDSAIPLIADKASFVEQTVGVSQGDIENSHKENGSSPNGELITETTTNGYLETSLNGYTLGTSKYLETSLDDLAHEIELYETGQQQLEVPEEKMEEPESPDLEAGNVPAVEKEADAVDANQSSVETNEEVKAADVESEETKVTDVQEPEREQEVETKQEAEEEHETEKDHEPESGSKPKKRFSLGKLKRRKAEKGEETQDGKETEQAENPETATTEPESEPAAERKPVKKSFSSRFKRGQKSTNTAEPAAEETEPKQDGETIETEPELEAKPPKKRFSFRLKRNQKASSSVPDTKDSEQAAHSEATEQAADTKETEPTADTEETAQAAAVQEDSGVAKEGEPAEDKSEETASEEIKPLESVPEQPAPVAESSGSSIPIVAEPVAEVEEESKESADSLEQPTKKKSFSFRRPRLRRGRDRPVSMVGTAGDRQAEPDQPLARENPARHSYHGGDLPSLHKSGSQTSLLSYSPNPNSSLVIEMMTDGELKHYRIPQSLFKRKAYDQRGTKIHIYNDHLFVATHFTESSNCAVCDNPISGMIGKQGYECRDCGMRTHKKCHCQNSVMCPSSTVKQMNIENLEESQPLSFASRESVGATDV